MRATEEGFSTTGVSFHYENLNWLFRRRAYWPQGFLPISASVRRVV